MLKPKPASLLSPGSTVKWTSRLKLTHPTLGDPQAFLLSVPARVELLNPSLSTQALGSRTDERLGP